MKSDFRLSHNLDHTTQPIPFHSHDFYEIYFFADGNVTYYVENEQYNLKKGDVLIIPPGKLHRPVIKENLPYERYVLWIYHSYLSTSRGIHDFIGELCRLSDEKQTHLVSFDDAAFQQVRQLLDKALHDFVSTKPLSEYTAESALLLLLERILQTLSAARPITFEQEELIPRVIVYLNENFTKAPSLDALADAFFVSKYYLSHRFREYTKTTIHNYILMKKIHLAKELLQSGVSPQSVCKQCGFSTYSNFYKAFVARVGVSPGRYVDA